MLANNANQLRCNRNLRITKRCTRSGGGSFLPLLASMHPPPGDRNRYPVCELLMPERTFISYAHCDLDRKKIRKYAKQYDGVNMAALKGITEDNFPFLIHYGDSPDDTIAHWWEPTIGIMTEMNDDPVESYAFAQYLLENAFPVFDSYGAAERWADEHDWPRRPLDG